MKTVPDPGLGVGALGIPHIENCAEDDVKHISVRPRKSDSIQTHRTTWTPVSLLRCAAHHRWGVVPVGEAS